jgi:hypothetical protein
MLVGARVLARVPTGPPGAAFAFRPGASQAFILIKCSLPRVLEPDQFDKVRPREAQERLPAERRRERRIGFRHRW